MRKLSAVALLVSTLAWPQASLEPPLIGHVVDSARSLRAVQGLAGAFALGPAVQDGVLSAASSGRYALVKTAHQIVAFGPSGAVIARYPAPAGGALFAFGTDGAPAFAYLAEAGALTRFSGGALEPVPLAGLDGKVLAIAAPRAGELRAIVRHDGRLSVFVIVPDSAWTTPLEPAPESTGPLTLLPDGSLAWVRGTELTIRDAQRQERRISLPAEAAAIEQMGENWLCVRTPVGTLAVRLAGYEVIVYELPEAAP